MVGYNKLVTSRLWSGTRSGKEDPNIQWSMKTNFLIQIFIYYWNASYNKWHLKTKIVKLLIFIKYVVHKLQNQYEYTIWITVRRLSLIWSQMTSLTRTKFISWRGWIDSNGIFHLKTVNFASKQGKQSILIPNCGILLLNYIVTISTCINGSKHRGVEKA